MERLSHLPKTCNPSFGQDESKSTHSFTPLPSSFGAMLVKSIAGAQPGRVSVETLAPENNHLS